MDILFGSMATYGTGTRLLIFCGRILLAVFCGAIIGYERTRRFKDAGLRTHCIVACASAALMILSKYGFSDLVLGENVYDGVHGADASRIAASVVSGIGFLGAAVVFKHGNSVRGLTTAAGIWATSAVGMLIGAGMEIIGIVVVACIIGVLNLFHVLNIGHDSYADFDIAVEMDDDPALRKFIDDDIAAREGTVLETSLRRENGRLKISLCVRLRKRYTYQDIETILEEHPGIHAMSVR